MQWCVACNPILSDYLLSIRLLVFGEEQHSNRRCYQRCFLLLIRTVNQMFFNQLVGVHPFIKQDIFEPLDALWCHTWYAPFMYLCAWVCMCVYPISVSNVQETSVIPKSSFNSKWQKEGCFVLRCMCAKSGGRRGINGKRFVHTNLYEKWNWGFAGSVSGMARLAMGFPWQGLILRRELPSLGKQKRCECDIKEGFFC